jgi:hypothetical protein
MGSKSLQLDFIVTTAVLATCLALWLHGLMTSPLVKPHVHEERRFIEHFLQGNRPDLQAEGSLARAYWQRYADIRVDAFYGEQGPNGLFGARLHYEQHGRGEGRIFAPLPEIEDQNAEQSLAESYWQRYPDVARSKAWGRNSALGLLGPRDHYNHIGRYEGRRWGAAAD